jgi:hypothetical protein
MEVIHFFPFCVLAVFVFILYLPVNRVKCDKDGILVSYCRKKESIRWGEVIAVWNQKYAKNSSKCFIVGEDNKFIIIYTGRVKGGPSILDDFAEHLQHLYQRNMAEVDNGIPCVMPKIFLRKEIRKVIIDKNHIETVSRGGERRRLLYNDVEFVYHHSDAMPAEFHTQSGDWFHTKCGHRYHMYNIGGQIEYIRNKTSPATWLDIDIKKPPQEPLAKKAFYKYKLHHLKNKILHDFGGSLTFIVCLILLFPKIIEPPFLKYWVWLFGSILVIAFLTFGYLKHYYNNKIKNACDL